MLPVLGREVVEAQQRVAILDQALDCLVVFDAPGLDEGVEGGKRILLGLGHPDFLQRALGFRLLAVWQFVEDIGSFVHPAALATRLGPDLFHRLPESERAIGDRELGANRQPTPLQIEEQFPPRLRTLAHTVGEADKLLPALGCGSNDDQQALRSVFQTGLHVNAVDPEVDVAFGREIAFAPACVLFAPGLLEASNGRGREPAGVPAEQCDQRVFEVAGRDALEVEDREQHLQALRPARVGRQNRRRKADALATFAAAVTHARAAHRHRTDAGHDLTLGQMSVAHQPPAAIIGELVGMAAEQARNLGLDGLRQNRSRAVAQNLGQRISKSSWLRELENISVGHGVSLLCWRSGGVEHPHDTPPYPFTPSPTFAHSSLVVGITVCVAIGYIVFLQPNPDSNVPNLPPSDAMVETPPDETSSTSSPSQTGTVINHSKNGAEPESF